MKRKQVVFAVMACPTLSMLFCVSSAFSQNQLQGDQNQAIQTNQMNQPNAGAPDNGGNAFKFVNINKTVQADTKKIDTSSVQGLIDAGERALLLEQYPRAESLFLQAQSNKGLSTDDAVHIMCCLGESYICQGKFDQAKKTMDKALSMAQKSKTDPVLLSRCMDSSSWLWQLLGDQSKSINLCAQAVEIQRQHLPANSPDLAETIEHLASLKAGAGQLVESSQLYQQAIDMRRNGGDSSSAMLANDVERLAVNLMKQGNSDEAARAFKLSLEMKQSSQAVLTAFTPHPYTANIEYNYDAGAPNCSQRFENGNLIQSVTANGVTVQATVLATPSNMKKSASIGVSFQNGSNQPITILSQPAMFMVLSPKPKMAQRLNNDAVADNIEKKAAKKASWVRFMGNQATLTSSTTMMGNYNNNYRYGGRYGYLPPGYAGNMYSYPGSYQGSNMVYATTSVPDLAARQRAYQKAAMIQEQSAAQADQLRQSAVGTATLAPGQGTEGTLDYDQSAFTQAILRVPVGNAVFVFTLDRTKKS